MSRTSRAAAGIDGIDGDDEALRPTDRPGAAPEPWWQNIWLAAWSSVSGSHRVVFPMPKSSQAIVEFQRARMEAGDLHGIIDRRYPLDSIVDAYRYVESAQKTGIVVIQVK
jgi:NADPH:quinone reductase-like Zn-dependent oxidoreductase